MQRMNRYWAWIGLCFLLGLTCSQKPQDPTLNDAETIVVAASQPPMECKLDCGTSAIEAVPGSVFYDPTSLGGSSVELKTWSIQTAFKASESLDVCVDYEDVVLKYAVMVKDDLGLPLSKIAVKWAVSGTAVTFGATGYVYACTDACGLSVAEIRFPLKTSEFKTFLPGNKVSLSVAAYSGSLASEEAFNTEIEVKAAEDCE